MGSLDNSFGFDWGMDVENGFEGGGELICQVGCIGCWICVERGSEDVTFEIVNINGFVGAVLYGRSFSWRADVWEKFECGWRTNGEAGVFRIATAAIEIPQLDTQLIGSCLRQIVKKIQTLTKQQSKTLSLTTALLGIEFQSLPVFS